jgi:DNA invertase Pin-like site-specific DNA recombinase
MRVDLMFLQQGMDTSTSSGRMMFSIFGALAEWERNLIRERVAAGIFRAKARGVKMGRPSNMTDGLRSAIQLLRENGMGIKQIAKEVGVGVGTVYSVINLKLGY